MILSDIQDTSYPKAVSPLDCLVACTSSCCVRMNAAGRISVLSGNDSVVKKKGAESGQGGLPAAECPTMQLVITPISLSRSILRSHVCMGFIFRCFSNFNYVPNAYAGSTRAGGCLIIHSWSYACSAPCSVETAKRMPAVSVSTVNSRLPFPATRIGRIPVAHIFDLLEETSVH